MERAAIAARESPALTGAEATTSGVGAAVGAAVGALLGAAKVLVATCGVAMSEICVAFGTLTLVLLRVVCAVAMAVTRVLASDAIDVAADCAALASVLLVS